MTPQKVHGADVLRSSLAIIEQNGGGENPGFPDLKRLETAQRGKQRPFSQIAGQSPCLSIFGIMGWLCGMTASRRSGPGLSGSRSTCPG